MVSKEVCRFSLNGCFNIHCAEKFWGTEQRPLTTGNRPVDVSQLAFHEQKQLHRTPALEEGNLILGWRKEKTSYCIFCLSPDKNKVTVSITKLQASPSWPMWVTATRHQLELQPACLGGTSYDSRSQSHSASQQQAMHSHLPLPSTLLSVTNQSPSKSHTPPSCWVAPQRPHVSSSSLQWAMHPSCSITGGLWVVGVLGVGQCFPSIYRPSVVLVPFLVFQDVFSYNLF